MSHAATRTMMELDHLVTELCLEFQSTYRYERRLFIPTEQAMASLHRRAAQLRSEIPAAAGDPIWKEHLLEILDVLDFRLKEDTHYPWRFILSFINSLDDHLYMDHRPEAERAAILAEKAPQLPDLFPELLRMLQFLPEERLQQVKEYTESLQRILPTARKVVSAWQNPALDNAFGTAQAAVDRFAADLALGVKRQQLLEPIPFMETMTRAYGYNLPEVLTWYEDDIARKKAELTELAAHIQPGKSPFAILEEELPPFPTPEQMFPALREYVRMAREACQRYIALPPGEVCEVVDIPEHLKTYYPWGGFWGGNALRGSLNGRVFLNSSNYQAVTKGWIQMNAVHECYPGHHAQRVKTAAGKLPESYKLGGFRMAKAVPLNEGIAHRSEELFENLFEDRAYPLLVKMRQLHTAVRIKAEISMHYLGRPRSEAVDLYVKEVAFSPKTADGQVRHTELWPGYFACYYYGHRKLNELKARTQVSDPDFTELTFACGYVSIDTVTKLLALPPEVRNTYLDGRAFGLA